MTPEMILFVIVGLATLFAAAMVVTTRNIFYAALWLVVALFGVAIVFVLLNAGFFAAAQVIIYIGAIVILFIFAIMLTNPSQQNVQKRFNEDWLMALIISCILFASLIWLLTRWTGIGVVPATSLGELNKLDPIRKLGEILVAPDGYLIPFELASVLLIAAMIGAIYIAWGKPLKKKSEE